MPCSKQWKFIGLPPQRPLQNSAPARRFILMPAVSELSIADSHSHRALDLLAAGQPAHAAQCFQAAIAADPAHVEAHHGLIRAMRDAGQVDQSLAAAMALTALT